VRSRERSGGKEGEEAHLDDDLPDRRPVAVPHALKSNEFVPLHVDFEEVNARQARVLEDARQRAHVAGEGLRRGVYCGGGGSSSNCSSVVVSSRQGGVQQDALVRAFMRVPRRLARAVGVVGEDGRALLGAPRGAVEELDGRVRVPLQRVRNVGMRDPADG
jgi:hypothetical protein